VKIQRRKYVLVKEYFANTQMTEEQADGVSKRWVEVDASVVNFDSNTFHFSQDAFGERSAMFFQLDRRVQMMIDLQLASSIPLIQPEVALKGLWIERSHPLYPMSRAAGQGLKNNSCEHPKQGILDAGISKLRPR